MMSTKINFQVLSIPEMKNVLGGYASPDYMATVCGSGSCSYFKSVLDHTPTSGTCKSLTGPMQSGCGCDGLVSNSSCYLKPTGI
jgi:hypothetical protein